MLVQTLVKTYLLILKISYWAKDGVQDAYERDLMKGQYDKQNQLYFNPQGNVTFAEAFATGYEFYQ